MCKKLLLSAAGVRVTLFAIVLTSDAYYKGAKHSEIMDGTFIMPSKSSEAKETISCVVYRKNERFSQHHPYTREKTGIVFHEVNAGKMPDSDFATLPSLWPKSE